MLETLWLKLEIQNRYLSMLAFSFVFSIVVLWLTKSFVPLPTGLASVFLISLAAAYPFVRYMKHEEESESVIKKRFSERNILRRHERELMIYLVFFVGVTFAYISSYYIWGASAFGDQFQAVNQIQGISGNASGGIGFSEILMNNLMVFAITFVIALVISAGTVFILVWNASILGVFVAHASQNALFAHVNVLTYLPHGLLEIGAYVLSGIAASLLSYQLDRKLRGKKFDGGAFVRVLGDVFILVVIGLGFLVLGAFVEVL